MKYFDLIPHCVEEEFIKCGTAPESLLYCVKADLDGEGCYVDVYIAFTQDTLHIMSGVEDVQFRRRKMKKDELSTFTRDNYSYIELSEIKRVYVDRSQYTARFMVEYENGDELPIARFSSGYADKFEKFAERLAKIKEKAEIDDSLLDMVKTRCPKCGSLFPDPNRPVCPKCVDRRSVIKRLCKMFGKFKWEMTGAIAAIMVGAVFNVISPYFGSKMLYDDVLDPEGRFFGKVAMIIIIMASASFVGLLLQMVSGSVMSYIAPKVAHRLRLDIFSSMQRLSLSFFTSKQTGSLMTRVERDSNNVYNFFTDIVPYGLVNIARMAGIIGIMFTLSPFLAAGIILILAIIHVIQHQFFNRQHKLYRKLNIAMRAGNNILSDAMNGQRVVKSFAKEDKEIKRYAEKNNEIFATDWHINRRLSNTLPVIWFICRMLSGILYCAGAYMVIKGQLAFGALTALIIYTDMCYEPINFFSWIGDRWAKCADAASRMFEILDSLPTVKEAENPIHIENMKGDISFKNVKFEYEAGRPILKNVSFDIKGGTMFGIVGKTGAGKSTIINLLARLYDVTDGEITIDGVPLKKIAFEDLRRNIGIVSQETYLFMGTIADNIRYARPDATMEEVIEAAKSANAHEFISKLQDGYDTKIGQSGTNLSGGERQRISIARAIIQKPNILILDEATASMDTRTERKIQVAIDSLKQGRTIISIAHRLSTLRDADMLCVIENGEVKENGTHDELIREKGKYFELYRLQSDALKFIQD